MARKEKKTKGKRKGSTNIKNNYQKQNVKVIVNTGSKGKEKEPAYNYPSSTHTTLYVPPSPVPTPFHLGSKEGVSPSDLTRVLHPAMNTIRNIENSIEGIQNKLKDKTKTPTSTTTKPIRPVVKVKTPVLLPPPLQPINTPSPQQNIIKGGETTDFRFSSPAPPSLENMYNPPKVLFQQETQAEAFDRHLDQQLRKVAVSKAPVKKGGPKNLGPPVRNQVIPTQPKPTQQKGEIGWFFNNVKISPYN